MPNLERFLEKSNTDNIIGTRVFLLQQCDLNSTWHKIEGQPATSKYFNIQLKNMNYFTAKSSIDIESAIQLTFDITTQLIEVIFHIYKNI